MTITEIQSVIDLGDLPIPINSYYIIADNVISLNNRILTIAIKVNKSYNKENIIDLNFNGITEGHLVFTSHKDELLINEMTEFEFLAFLIEADYENYVLDTYKFKDDYVIINESFWNTYKADYEKTSPLWGGFSHKLNFTEPLSNYISNVLEIEAGDKLKELDNYSYESTIRAIEQPYAFERFLKLYHLLELQFDFYIIEKIKNLNLPNEANNIGKLLKNYSKNSNELDKLTEIIRSNCLDFPSLEAKLELALPFKTLAEEIFVTYGNESKPLGKLADFSTVFDSTSLSKANLISLRITKENTHNEFIIKLTSYWIYRIRCSVAHNKIGEYLLSWDDEEFIVKFAEPLLNDVLKQCFKT